MRTVEEIKAMKLNVNVAGNRAELLKDFIGAYKPVYTLATELNGLYEQYLNVNDNGNEELEQLEEQLADVESKLTYVSELKAGKELLKMKQNIQADIELLQTINAGSEKRIQQDIIDKAVELYEALSPAQRKVNELVSEIVNTASVMTYEDDNRCINELKSAVAYVGNFTGRVFKDADIVPEHAHSYRGNGKALRFNTDSNVPARELNVLDALKRGKMSLDSSKHVSKTTTKGAYIYEKWENEIVK